MYDVVHDGPLKPTRISFVWFWEHESEINTSVGGGRRKAESVGVVRCPTCILFRHFSTAKPKTIIIRGREAVLYLCVLFWLCRKDRHGSSCFVLRSFPYLRACRVAVQ